MSLEGLNNTGKVSRNENQEGVTRTESVANLVQRGRSRHVDNNDLEIIQQNIGSVNNLTNTETRTDNRRLSESSVSEENICYAEDLLDGVIDNSVNTGSNRIRTLNYTHDLLDGVNDGRVGIVDNENGQNDITDRQFEKLLNKAEKSNIRHRLGDIDNIAKNFNLTDEQKISLNDKKQEIIENKLTHDITTDLSGFVKDFKKVTDPGLTIHKSKIKSLHEALNDLSSKTTPSEKLEAIANVKEQIIQYKALRGEDSTKMAWVDLLCNELVSLKNNCENEVILDKLTSLNNKFDEIMDSNEFTDGQKVGKIRTQVGERAIPLIGDLKVISNRSGIDNNENIDSINNLLDRCINVIEPKDNNISTTYNERKVANSEKTDKIITLNDFTQNVLSEINPDSDNVQGEVSESINNNYNIKDNNLWRVAFSGKKENVLPLISESIKSSTQGMSLTDDQINVLSESIYNGIVDGFNQKSGSTVKVLEEYNGEVDLGRGMNECEAPPSKIEIDGSEYNLEKLVAVGGGGMVYAFKDPETDKTIICKSFYESANPINELKNHLQALGDTGHDNVIDIESIYLSKTGGGFVFLELANGGDAKNLSYASSVINFQNALPEKDLLLYMQKFSSDAFDSLIHVNENMDVIHRDLKPENFLYDMDKGKFLLSDFGEAIENSETNKDTMGSPQYMSPEMINGNGDYTTKTDTWSLGITLFEMYTGNAPFGMTNSMSKLDTISTIINAAENEMLPFPEPKNDFESMINQMLKANPDERPTLSELRTGEFFTTDFGSNDESKELIDRMTDFGSQVKDRMYDNSFKDTIKNEIKIKIESGEIDQLTSDDFNNLVDRTMKERISQEFQF